MAALLASARRSCDGDACFTWNRTRFPCLTPITLLSGRVALSVNAGALEVTAQW